jgi:hypothetical protein
MKKIEIKNRITGDGFIYQNHSNSNIRKIEAYYESVVNFIKWYEQNNN